MTITQLEYVVAVATFKSFVAAAEKCFVTQPTLSMQIQKLEDELDVKLFDRNKHPIVPTPIGEEIVQQAKIILAEANKIQEIIKNKSGSTAGMIRLAIIPTLAPYLAPQLITNITNKYPDIRLTIHEYQTHEIVSKLKNDELDCALVSTPLDDQAIKEYPLFMESLVGYFGPNEAALKNKSISVDDLEMQRFWMLNEGNCLRNQIINLCNEQIAKLQDNKPFKYETSNVESLTKMIDKLGGHTILPEFSILDFPESNLDRVRYFAGEEPVREISMITNNHFVKMSLMQLLIDEVLNIVPEKMKVQSPNRKVLRIQTSKL